MLEKILLTDEESQKAVNDWVDESWSSRSVSLNRGHWEDAVEVTNLAQVKKMAEIVDEWLVPLREAMGLKTLEEVVSEFLDIWEDMWQALKQELRMWEVNDA